MERRKKIFRCASGFKWKVSGSSSRSSGRTEAVFGVSLCILGTMDEMIQPREDSSFGKIAPLGVQDAIQHQQKQRSLFRNVGDSNDHNNLMVSRFSMKNCTYEMPDLVHVIQVYCLLTT